MDHLDHLDWPFFDAHHCALAAGLDAWAGVHLADQAGDVDTACRGLVARLVFAGCRIPASARIGTGGQGSSRAPVERLYRDIRALRIDEGASEVPQLIIARDLLAAERAAAS
jgi:alkylation response protein AidB-like acyl-CoA dehydrogenase